MMQYVTLKWYINYSKRDIYFFIRQLPIHCKSNLPLILLLKGRLLGQKSGGLGVCFICSSAWLRLFLRLFLALLF